MNLNWRAWSAFVALGIIWGMPYLLIKVAVIDLSPALIAWARIVIAAAILFPIAWHRGALRGLARHRAAICAFALLEMVIPFTAIALGERWITSSAAGMLIATVPLWSALLSRYFGVHERLGPWRLLGMLLGSLGVAVLLGFGTTDGSLGWAGVACILLATLGYAVGPLIVQRHLSGVDALGPVAASLAVASILLLPPALLALPDHLPSPTVLVSILVLGAICTALALILMFFLIGQAGASRTLVITYINPAVAALLGVLLLHEHIGVGAAGAFGLILVGSWLAARGARPRARGEGEAEAVA